MQDNLEFCYEDIKEEMVDEDEEKYSEMAPFVAASTGENNSLVR